MAKQFEIDWMAVVHGLSQASKEAKERADDCSAKDLTSYAFMSMIEANVLAGLAGALLAGAFSAVVDEEISLHDKSPPVPPQSELGHKIEVMAGMTGDEVGEALNTMVEESIAQARVHDEETPIEDLLIDSGMTGHAPSGKFKKEEKDEAD